MTKTVFFRSRDKLGPIQTDEVDESFEVKLVCDTEFIISLKDESASRYIDYQVVYMPVKPKTVEFKSFQLGERRYEIRLKFNKDQFPNGGLDYTVRIGEQILDPRWVPPGGNEE